MSKKIYVGNLSFSSTEDSLRDLFSSFGEVDSVVVMTDKFTGQSKGFGFVTMEDEGALKAVHALNGKDFEGRRLRVNEALERRQGRGGAGSGTSYSRGGHTRDSAGPEDSDRFF